MSTVLTPELMEKLERLRSLEIEAQELRAELQPWLDNACKQYLVAWLENQMEKGQDISILELKSNLSDLAYHSAMNDNVALWHQISEVKKLLAIYETNRKT
ncbi:hypothetical protein LVJ83_04830 [Uruburuella testudinis]|uniref:Uncharacterized protein n=1 Tax=Uruburuella testudinis TaxID=1282863 RepID=A0ABY4DXJ1_9NEIS|nr:hypothetical protein [Uruburuella testudinis]UOO82794.1 hypothetical protein LVJ83_04830 [Uruburuella testudinis]